MSLSYWKSKLNGLTLKAKAQVLKSSLQASVFMSLALAHAPLQFLCLSLYFFGFFF